MEVNPSNFVRIGVGALNHKVTLAVSTPREPNALAKAAQVVLLATQNPELARALQNDGFEPAQISVHDHMKHRQAKVILDPILV